VVVAYEPQTQPSVQVSYFVYACRGVDDGADPGLYEDTWVLVGILWRGFAGGILTIPFLATPVVSGRTVRLGLTWRAEQNEGAKINAARVVTIEHAPADMQAAVQGPDGASYVPGGLLWRIDETLNGAPPAWGVSEAGLALSPEVSAVTATPAAGGNITPSKTYLCRYYYRDITGERSTALGSVTVVMGGAQGTINHTVPTLTHTNRRKVVIDVFRTEGDPRADSPFHLAGTVANSRTADTVAFADTLSDATLRTRPRDPVTLGEADEVAPLACQVVAFGEGRGALAGIDDEGSIWLSKQRGPTEPVRWSDIMLTAADFPVPGRITAMAWNGPDLIVWRARSIQVLSGRGPDNSGNGATMEPARVISFEVGCRSARAHVRVQQGWLFQSLDGAYWLLDTSLQLTYVGADIEALDEACVGAFAVHALKQARFVTATRTHVVQYDGGGWTTWSRSGISAAALPDGTGLYLPSSASALLLQDDTGFRDTGDEYAQRLRLAWFRPQGIHGEIAVRRILVAGGYTGTHHPLARISYDYEPGHQETFEWEAETVVGTVVQGDGVQVFGGPSRLDVATQVYQFAIPVARERCMAIGVELLDRSAGGESLLGDSFWVTAVAYEWAPVPVEGSSAYRLEERRLAEVS
jgi:hypothetical protein